MSKDDKPTEDQLNATFIDCDFSENGTGMDLGAGKYKFVRTKTNNNKEDGIIMREGATASFESHEAKGNGRFGITTLANAIKKPRANNNRGLKVIVGTILTGFIIGVLVHEYGLLRGKANVKSTQSQAQEPIKSNPEN